MQKGTEGKIAITSALYCVQQTVYPSSSASAVQLDSHWQDLLQFQCWCAYIAETDNDFTVFIDGFR